MKNCTRCATANSADSNYCGRCGTSLLAGGETAGAAFKFPRSLIAIEAVRLVISAVMLAILLFFFVMFMALAGNLSNLGNNGNNQNCDQGQHWDSQQNKCVPDGGGNQIDIQSVNVQTQSGWMQLDGQPTCSPCQVSAGSKVEIRFNLRNTDSTDHQVTDIQIQTSGFSRTTTNPNLPAQIMASSSVSFTVELNTPGQSWSGQLQISVQGN